MSVAACAELSEDLDLDPPSRGNAPSTYTTLPASVVVVVGNGIEAPPEAWDAIFDPIVSSEPAAPASHIQDQARLDPPGPAVAADPPHGTLWHHMYACLLHACIWHLLCRLCMYMKAETPMPAHS